MNHPSQILQRYGLEPKKSLGQNFLFDDNVLGRIVAAANVQPADVVLEIGPGLGHLTRLLAAAARQVVAVELDDRLIPVLQERLADLDNVQLIHGDILAQNPSELFATPYKVAANVPYYITGAILRHLLDAPHKPTQMVMTVQKEVAERVTAVPPNMSLLSVTVQFYAQATMAGVIKAGAFYPRPDVDSAILALDLTQAPPLGIPPDEVARFFRLVKVGFSQKRKQLQKNLRQLGMDKKIVAQGLVLAGIDGRARAETLSLEQWAALYKQLYHAPK
jgi:16S rRNA (adenine1518-N6/adenine1519-N6)-dimethyltransferase